MRVPVLVIADVSWQRLELGSRLRTSGRLQPARTSDLAGVLSPRGPPVVVEQPGPFLRSADHLRASIRDAVAGHPPGPRALVPALVDGDDGAMPEDLKEDFRTSGLTHLLAVSGTNLTLVVGSLLLLARWAGVRARGLAVVGALGVVGFVLLARTEPSVVRAAAMGAVGLIGMGHHGRRRGTRALGAAVLLLLLFDPWLALTMGFALSVLATAGILWLAPGWRDRLMRWLPRWVAEAVSVPLAAQIACTPLVAAISGQVSLVAVGANLLAAPAVGPATVLGLAGGVVGLVAEPVGRIVAAPAAWCAGWIIAVAVRGADLPVAAFDWPAGPIGIASLTLICAALSLFLGALLARRVTTLGLGGLMVCALLFPLPTPGWPAKGWVMVACDVGQGDGLVLNAGRGTAVVVDAGPDPAPMDRCLRRLGVERVPLVVLTHFHADHVDGLAGVLKGRRVGAIEVTSVADPASGVRMVQGVAGRAGVPVLRASYGETRRLGPLSWQVIAPSRPPSLESESPANDSSLVLLVEVHGSPDPPARRPGGAVAGTAPAGDRGSAGRRAEGGPPRQREPGPRTRPRCRCPARTDLGRGRQRLRSPGAVADGDAARPADARRTHRQGRRRRGHRARRHAGGARARRSRATLSQPDQLSAQARGGYPGSSVSRR